MKPESGWTCCTVIWQMSMPRIENLRIVGVTREETPEVFDTFMEYTTKAYAVHEDSTGAFLYSDPSGRDILSYGGYRFESECC